jgi:hypothetical protein
VTPRLVPQSQSACGESDASNLKHQYHDRKSDVATWIIHAIILQIGSNTLPNSFGVLITTSHAYMVPHCAVCHVCSGFRGSSTCGHGLHIRPVSMSSGPYPPDIDATEAAHEKNAQRH